MSQTDNHMGDRPVANSVYSEADLLRANQEHDQRIRFDPRSGIYESGSPCSDGKVVACPSLDKRLSNAELDEAVWAWHCGDDESD